MLELAQSGPGAALQLTPAQGSALQVPFAHPKGQVLSVVAYPQAPAVQVPDAV